MRGAVGRAGGRAGGRTEQVEIRVLIVVVGSLFLAAGPPDRLAAQTPDSLNVVRIPALVHYGKWLALGGAVWSGVLSVQRHDDANSAYNTLQSRCFEVPAGCQLVGGRYVDPVNEALFQDTRRLDHQASRYLIGTETLFVASMGGFVWELMHRHVPPKNIPFAPRVEAGMTSTCVGLSVRF